MARGSNTFAIWRYVLNESVFAYPLRVRQQKRPPERTSPGVGAGSPFCRTGLQSAAGWSRWRKRLRPPWKRGEQSAQLSLKSFHCNYVRGASSQIMYYRYACISWSGVQWSSGWHTQLAGYNPGSTYKTGAITLPDLCDGDAGLSEHRLIQLLVSEEKVKPVSMEEEEMSSNWFVWSLPKANHLKATDSRMARTKWLLVVEGLRPIREAHALGSFRGAFNRTHTG